MSMFFNSRGGYTSLIEGFRGESYLVVPVHGERIKRIGEEVVHVLELSADTFLHQRYKVNIANLAIVERKAKDIVTNVVGRQYFQNVVLFHG